MYHGPYSIYDWCNDFCWAACFAFVLIRSLRIHFKRRRLFLLGSILFLISQIPMQGAFCPIDLLVLGFMDIHAIRYFIQPWRSDCPEPNPEGL